MIAVVDYDAGNIKSVEKALQYIGEKPVITREISQINKADKVIVPGVGAFAQAMENLKKYELDKVIHEITEQGTPFLGICLGLQLLFEESDEGKERKQIKHFKLFCSLGKAAKYAEDRK